MREIEFRAWIKDKNRMEFGIGVNPYYVTDCDRLFWKHEEVELMQFTGLHDKNNNKIYEGDIVRYNTDDDFDCYSIVKFGTYKQDGSGGEYSGRECLGFYVDVDNFTCPDWTEDDASYFPHYLCTQNLNEVCSVCEIIGNIYENNELLS